MSVQNARDIVKLEVDYTTPLQDQFAALAAAAKSRDDWWRVLDSSNYPPLRTGKQNIDLRERCFVQNFINGMEVADVIGGNIGEHAADPYMFVAWLRHKPKAGVKYSIAAIGQVTANGDCFPCVPFASERDGARYLNDVWLDIGWDGNWRFLVSCG